MIGRGTRLCPDVFGPGKKKEHFYIFDWCGNFDYFSKPVTGIASMAVQSLTERLFCLRLDIAYILQHADHQAIAFDKQLHDDLKQLLHRQVDRIGKERKELASVLEHHRTFPAEREMDLSLGSGCASAEGDRQADSARCRQRGCKEV